MIKDINKKRSGFLEIDLTGPDGNVFVMMAYAKKLAKKIYDDKHPDISEQNEISDLLGGLGAQYEEFKSIGLGDFICKRMQESDYEHAIDIFEEYFGEHVVLWR